MGLIHISPFYCCLYPNEHPLLQDWRPMSEQSVPQTNGLSVDARLEIFGEKIRTFRRARGLTQLELAENSALDRKTISRIENHQYSPSLSTIFSIAEALEVEPKDLMP